MSTALTHPIIGPGHYMEDLAFNPSSQPKNSLQKEVLARIVAIAAPFFHLYQIVVHATIVLVEGLTCLIGISDGKLSKNALSSVAFSIRNLASSICEIPHKLVNGPNNVQDYFGNHSRHRMSHHVWANKVVWY